MLDVGPPKGHWRDPVSYAGLAAESGEEFAALVSEKLEGGFEQAASEGGTMLSGPLGYVGGEEVEQPFLIDGCDFSISTATLPEEPEVIDEEYLFEKEFPIEVRLEGEDGEDVEQPEKPLEEAEELLAALNSKIEELNGLKEANDMACEGVVPHYIAKAFSIRSAGHHAAQLTLDNAALLEFCAQRDADIVREATEGWGTDEDTLVRVLCALSKQQIVRVNEIYKEKFGQTLKDLLEGELSGFFGGSTDFSYFMNCMMQNGAQSDSQFFVESMKGWGTDEKLLTEMVCTR